MVLKPLLELAPTPGPTTTHRYDERTETEHRRQLSAHAYVSISRDATSGARVYEVHEPSLTPGEARQLDRIWAALPRILPARQPVRALAERRRLLTDSVREYLGLHGDPTAPVGSTDRLLYYIERDALGYGPIDAILRDPEVEDVSCDGVGVPVYVFQARFGSVQTNVLFPVEEALNSFVVLLGQRCGRSLSVYAPLLDGSTIEGHRVQATYAREVTSRGASFTLRRFRDRPFTPFDLLRSGAATPEMVAYLWLAVEHGDSLIVCGGPGAGKTSTLNAISLFIPPSAKLLSIEDTRELTLPHAHWVPAVTRGGTGRPGADGNSPGEIDMFALVSAALRQRPSHIIVGEVRGREAYAMFQAMATGHSTYSTIHADSVRAMVTRLENAPLYVPRALLASLRTVVIEAPVCEGGGSARRIREIVEIVGLEPETNDLITNSVFEWDPVADRFRFQGHSYLLDRLSEAWRVPLADVEAELGRRADLLRNSSSTGPEDFRALWRRFASEGSPEGPRSQVAPTVAP